MTSFSDHYDGHMISFLWSCDGHMTSPHLSEGLGKEDLIVRGEGVVLLNVLQHGQTPLPPEVVLFREGGHFLLSPLEQSHSLQRGREREPQNNDVCVLSQ